MIIEICFFRDLRAFFLVSVVLMENLQFRQMFLGENLMLLLHKLSIVWIKLPGNRKEYYTVVQNKGKSQKSNHLRMDLRICRLDFLDKSVCLISLKNCELLHDGTNKFQSLVKRIPISSVKQSKTITEIKQGSLML